MRTREGKTSCKDCPAANTKGMTKCSCETGQYVAMGTVTGDCRVKYTVLS